jgi:response regulator RpfG family c-di-GMP phosphodiesterase
VAGLQTLTSQGPFAAVVTDFHMPGMDGVQFLEKVQSVAPDTIRIMLTGQANTATAMDAVNRGHIFRFQTKPCAPEVFASVLEAALRQYKLVHAERELLEHTVKGSIEVLADVLALANPAAFGRATRIRDYVRQIVRELRLPDPWQYETAALLSQIGCVAVPNDVFDRIAAGEELAPAQAAMLEGHPSLARDLLKKIPRLQTVAEIVYHQRATDLGVQDGRAVILGAKVLAAAIEFDSLVSMGATPRQALEALERSDVRYDKRALDALAHVGVASGVHGHRSVGIAELETGMLLAEEIRNRDGLLIVARGHELTEGSLLRIRNYAALNQLPKLVVRVQSRAAGGAAAA